MHGEHGACANLYEKILPPQNKNTCTCKRNVLKSSGKSCPWYGISPMRKWQLSLIYTHHYIITNIYHFYCWLHRTKQCLEITVQLRNWPCSSCRATWTQTSAPVLHCRPSRVLFPTASETRWFQSGRLPPEEDLSALPPSSEASPSWRKIDM